MRFCRLESSFIVETVQVKRHYCIQLEVASLKRLSPTAMIETYFISIHLRLQAQHLFLLDKITGFSNKPDRYCNTDILDISMRCD